MVPDQRFTRQLLEDSLNIVLNNILDLLIDSTSGYGITQIVSAVFFLIIVYVASVNYRSQTLPR